MAARAYRRWSPPMEAQLADLLQKGMATCEIATEMDVTTEAVR